jgi:hypothetical protein
MMQQGEIGEAAVRARLASWLVDLQPGLKPENAARVIDRVADDQRVMKMAIEWMEIGRPPAKPEMREVTPASLADDFKPAVVLVLWYALYNDPDGAQRMLAHPWGGWFRREIVIDAETGHARFAEPVGKP